MEEMRDDDLSNLEHPLDPSSLVMILIADHRGVGMPEDSVQEEEMVAEHDGKPQWD